MKAIGKVNVPQEAFMAVLKSNQGLIVKCTSCDRLSFLFYIKLVQTTLLEPNFLQKRVRKIFLSTLL